MAGLKPFIIKFKCHNWLWEFTKVMLQRSCTKKQISQSSETTSLIYNFDKTYKKANNLYRCTASMLMSIFECTVHWMLFIAKHWYMHAKNTKLKVEQLNVPQKQWMSSNSSTSTMFASKAACKNNKTTIDRCTLKCSSSLKQCLH